jgi:hypothetical protein
MIKIYILFFFTLSTSCIPINVRECLDSLEFKNIESFYISYRNSYKEDGKYKGDNYSNSISAKHIKNEELLSNLRKLYHTLQQTKLLSLDDIPYTEYQKYLETAYGDKELVIVFGERGENKPVGINFRYFQPNRNYLNLSVNRFGRDPESFIKISDHPEIVELINKVFKDYKEYREKHNIKSKY